MSETVSDTGGSDSNQALLNAPWFQEAFKAAVEFYEKDKILDSKDRLDLSKAYLSISRAQLFGGWAGFAAVFGTPFVYQFYKTNAIRGVKVPRNFVFGVVGMFVTTQLAGGYVYRSKLRALDPNNSFESVGNYDANQETAKKTDAQRQYEMMKLLRDGQATRWSNYFYMTYTNPERRLPDPRVKLNEMKEGRANKVSPFLNQRDPMGLYSGPKFDKKEGVPQIGNPGIATSEKSKHTQDDDDFFEVADGGRDGQNSSLSSWDKVRQQNGINPVQSQNSSWSQLRQQKQSVSTPTLSAAPITDLGDSPEQASQSEFDAMLEKERHSSEDNI